MDLRVIPRTAIDRYLRVVRLPLDGVIELFRGNGTGAQPAAKLALDRADARLRGLARALEEGGPKLWAEFMAELRETHLRAPNPKQMARRSRKSTRISAKRKLQAAYEPVLAKRKP